MTLQSALDLARQFPAHHIWTADTHWGDRAIVARASTLDTHPWCVVARDPEEIRQALGGR